MFAVFAAMPDGLLRTDEICVDQGPDLQAAKREGLYEHPEQQAAKKG